MPFLTTHATFGGSMANIEQLNLLIAGHFTVTTFVLLKNVLQEMAILLIAQIQIQLFGNSSMVLFMVTSLTTLGHTHIAF